MQKKLCAILAFTGILSISQSETHADTAPPPPSQPTISCTAISCSQRSAQDVCHFGKVEWWIEGENRRTRYNMYCEPTCLSAETTCWISGFPEPGRNNFIDWTSGKKPKEMYPYNLKKTGYGYVLELIF